MPPRIAKLLAAVAAIAMVGAALWFRNRDDSGDGGSDPQSGPKPKVVCVTELREVCDALDGVEVVRVEAAGTTADALAEGVPDFDAWVTIDPWPAMVDYVRGQAQQAALFTNPEPKPLASSDLVLLLQGTLPSDCGWNCAVDASGEQQELAIPPGDAAWGPQVVGEAFSSHLHTTDFSTVEIDGTGSQWLEQLLSFGPAQGAERRMATEGPAAYVAAGTTDQRAQPAVGSAAGQQRGLHLGTPELPARADVVVAQVSGGESVDLQGDAVATAFDQNGWTSPAADGATGLPAADLLVALREKMDE